MSRPINEDLLKELFLYLKKYIRLHGISPSYKDILENCHFKSKETVFSYLRLLEQRELIQLSPNRQRGIRIVEPEIVYVPIVKDVTVKYNLLAPNNISSYAALSSTAASRAGSVIIGFVYTGEDFETLGIKKNDTLFVSVGTDIPDRDCYIVVKKDDFIELKHVIPPSAENETGKRKTVKKNDKDERQEANMIGTLIGMQRFFRHSELKS